MNVVCSVTLKDVNTVDSRIVSPLTRVSSIFDTNSEGEAEISSTCDFRPELHAPADAPRELPSLRWPELSQANETSLSKEKDTEQGFGFFKVTSPIVLPDVIEFTIDTRIKLKKKQRKKEKHFHEGRKERKVAKEANKEKRTKEENKASKKRKAEKHAIKENNPAN